MIPARTGTPLGRLIALCYDAASGLRASADAQAAWAALCVRIAQDGRGGEA
jgi:hypothetical protein